MGCANLVSMQGFGRASLIGSTATLVGSIRGVLSHCSDPIVQERASETVTVHASNSEHAVKVEGLEPCLLNVLT